ncbi:nucleotidyltransferase family protein [Dermabacteraceae bacterium P9123]
MDSMTIGVPAQLQLCHAALTHCANLSGARVLHIKGITLSPQLSAERPASTDSDVLVAPEDLPAYLRTLEENGWELYTHFKHGSVFQHAATYYHSVWGTVDVHRSFPGIDRDPAATFAALWHDREKVELGGWDCYRPSLNGQRLLLLVHAARDQMGKAVHDVRTCWEDLNDSERQQLRAFASSLGGEVALAAAIGQIETVREERGYRLWKAVSAGANPTEIWIARLQETRGFRNKARIFWQALHVNPDHLRIRLGRVPTEEDLRHERWDRWRRAARNIGGKVRSLSLRR